MISIVKHQQVWYYTTHVMGCSAFCGKRYRKIIFVLKK